MGLIIRIGATLLIEAIKYLARRSSNDLSQSDVEHLKFLKRKYMFESKK